MESNKSEKENKNFILTMYRGSRKMVLMNIFSGQG